MINTPLYHPLPRPQRSSAACIAALPPKSNFTGTFISIDPLLATELRQDFQMHELGSFNHQPLECHICLPNLININKNVGDVTLLITTSSQECPAFGTFYNQQPKYSVRIKAYKYFF